jgi:hypothetical protein
MRARLLVAALAVAFMGCGPSVWGQRPAAWLGSRKRTLEVGEATLRAAMAEAGVRRVEAPGNDEPVMVNPHGEGAPTCLTSAWFTVDGAAKEMLGDGFQYAWQLCAGGGKTTVAVSCLAIHKSEAHTDSAECEGGRIAVEVASRTERLMARMK